MEGKTSQQSQSSLRAQSSFGSEEALHVPKDMTSANYDPCANAKPCSPFYTYNHDSPRPSTDGAKFKPSVVVSVHDLELGDSITPTITQEKLQNIQKPKQSRFNLFQKKEHPLRTTPKQKGRIARLPKKQRIIVRSCIALLIVGCMIGIAVGIAAGLKSGVWKSNNQQTKIGR